jgi:hypothetical protein
LPSFAERTACVGRDACVAEIQTPAYKGPSVRGNVARKKHVDGMMQRGLFVKRVVHAVAVETTTHPVAVRHVKNNMAPALLSSHCPPVVHRLHARLPERKSVVTALRIRRGARERCRVVMQNRSYGLQARIPPA